MYEKASYVFWITLFLYIATLLTVSYVGVYLTYIAIPLIILSGLIMKFSTPSKRSQEIIDVTKSTIIEARNATDNLLNEVNLTLNDFSNSLDNYNLKTKLINERTRNLKEEVHKTKLAKAIPEIKLDYAKTLEEKSKYKELVNGFNKKITQLENEIEDIKKECELEVAMQQVS